jgi:hypothetical protein
LKSKRIGERKHTTYLVARAAAIKDTVAEPSVAILDGFGIQASLVVTDATSPTLASFSLDLDTEVLRLYFNEPVRISSLNISKAFLASSLVTSSASTIHFNSATTLTTTEDYAKNVTFKLIKDDLNRLKAIEGLAVSPNTTFLACEEGMAQDASISNAGEGNELESIPLSSAIPGAFTKDDVRPQLEKFDLNMDGAAQLVLKFSETVRVDSDGLDVSAITLFELGGETYTLTGGSISQSNDPVVTITLSSDDANEIKNRTSLAVSHVNNTKTVYISATDALVKDMSNNNVKSIEVSDNEAVEDFEADSSPPALSSFSLNMDDGFLTLVFSETIDISTIDPKEMEIVSSLELGSPSIALNGGEVSAKNLTAFTVKLLADDLNNVKKNTQLATGLESTAIFITN